jgi:hypothetical protein
MAFVNFHQMPPTYPDYRLAAEKAKIEQASL